MLESNKNVNILLELMSLILLSLLLFFYLVPFYARLEDRFLASSVFILIILPLVSLFFLFWQTQDSWSISEGTSLLETKQARVIRTIFFYHNVWQTAGAFFYALYLFSYRPLGTVFLSATFLIAVLLGFLRLLNLALWVSLRRKKASTSYRN